MTRLVAATLALALAGCTVQIQANVPDLPGPNKTPKPTTSSPIEPAPPSGEPPRPSIAPTVRPSARPSDRPIPTPRPTAPWTTPPSWYPSSPGIYPSAPAPRDPTVILSGRVYDEDGETVDGGLITVRSLDASVPYSATATTSQGSWVVNNLPEGANMEIVATKDGWTSRRRVGAFQRDPGQRHVLDFGSALGVDEGLDAWGEAYFISDRPEIAQTTPTDDATEVDPSRVVVKLRLSEPLDEDNRDAFAAAIAIWPADANAGVPGAYDLERDEDTTIDDGVARFGTDFGRTPLPATIGWAVREGEVFRDSGERTIATWNAEGTEVTLMLNAPLPSSANAAAKYQIGLVAGDDDIDDPDGNRLGLNDPTGDHDRLPGTLIANAFREVDLSVRNYPGSSPAQARWASTHASVSTFEVTEGR